MPVTGVSGGAGRAFPLASKKTRGSARGHLGTGPSRRSRRAAGRRRGSRARTRLHPETRSRPGIARRRRPERRSDAIKPAETGGRRWGKGGAPDRPRWPSQRQECGAGGIPSRRSVPSETRRNEAVAGGERRRSDPPHGPQRRSSAPVAAVRAGRCHRRRRRAEAVASGGKGGARTDPDGPRSGRFGAGGGVPERSVPSWPAGDEAVAGGEKAALRPTPLWPPAAAEFGAGRRRPEAGDTIVAGGDERSPAGKGGAQDRP